MTGDSLHIGGAGPDVVLLHGLGAIRSRPAQALRICLELSAILILSIASNFQ